MYQVKSEKYNIAEGEPKKNREKKTREELTKLFFQCTVYPSASLWTHGLCTCQHTTAHMFLLLHDRLWRNYRKTVSVCALGQGQRRGRSNINKSAFPTMSSTFPSSGFISLKFTVTLLTLTHHIILYKVLQTTLSHLFKHTIQSGDHKVHLIEPWLHLEPLITVENVIICS